MYVLVIVNYRGGFVFLKKKQGDNLNFEVTTDPLELKELLKIGAVVLGVKGFMIGDVSPNIPNYILHNKNYFLQINVLQEEQETIQGYILRDGGKYPKFNDNMHIVEIVDNLLYIANYIEKIFYKRQGYFKVKADVIKLFNLPANELLNTGAGISSIVLNAKKADYKDRLNFDLKIDQIPPLVKNFYTNIKKEFLNNGNWEELEKQKLKIKLCNIEHVLGFGGIHGAKKNIIEDEDLLYIDFTSFYPSLMINYNFFSRSIKDKKDFIKVYIERIRLKEKGDTKEKSYKLILNSTYRSYEIKIQ